MKHIFVVNPQAGGRDSTEQIRSQIEKLGLDSELYVTRSPLDATRYVAGRVACEAGEGMRFYACGGDGTLSEVASGLAGTGAELACYPCGSGNDYIKCWPNSDFTNLERLVCGTAVPVDLMRVNDRYGINVVNFGFEAEVCRTMQRVRRWPLLGGRMGYITGIVHCLFHAMKNHCRMTVDGEEWRSGTMLLGSAASGQYVGGGFRCAPRAVVDDGWLEVLSVDSLPLHRFVKIIGHYRAGTHLDEPQRYHEIHYMRGRRVTLWSDTGLSVVVDGELMHGQRFDIECLPQAVRFVIPQKD